MKKLLFVSFSLSLLACCFVVPTSIAQEAEWVDVSPPPFPDSPIGRDGHAMVYDSERGVIVMFGGCYGYGTGNPQFLNDLWELKYDRDTETWTWTNRTPLNNLDSMVSLGKWPCKRNAHSMAYDNTRKVTVLFGGWNGTNALNDTWVWDGTEWTEKTPITSPSERWWHSMAYDSYLDEVVLFGGHHTIAQGLDDTWVWDGSDWTPISISEKPQTRESHIIVYDDANGDMILFGGWNTNSLGDTWRWNGSAWSEIGTTIPFVRHAFGMAYDSTRNVVVLYGGLSDNNPKDETWEFNGFTWENVSDIAGTSLGKLIGPAMAFYGQRKLVVLFGGRDGINDSDKTWVYGPVCIENEITATDPDGNGNYCSSIQEAVDLVDGEGWEITVGSGEYDEYVLIRGKVNLAIRTSCAAEVKGFMLQKCNNITIDGFTIDAEGSGANGVTLMGGNNDNSDVTITNCDIHGAGNSYSGIKAARGNPNTTIIGNHIHHNGRNGIVFIDAAGGPHFITNNIIEANGWNGVKVARQHEITLTGNTITANGTRSGTTGGRYGVLRERTTGTGWPEGITLINNVITDNNGTVQTGKSSIDLGNYDQMLDETDSGNTTTSGDEGPGVS